MLVGGAPRASHADERHGRAVSVEIDASGTADAAALGDALRGRVLRQLDRLQITVEPDSAAQLAIGIRWKDPARTTYALSVALERDGEVLAQEDRACELCSTDELFMHTSFAVANVAQALSSEDDVPPPRPRRVRVVRPSGRVDAARPVRLSRMGWAGFGLGVGGVALAATGTSLWAGGGWSQPHSQDRTRDLKPTGIALVAVGSSLVAAGITMVAVDATRSRRRRISLSPSAAPGFGGVALAGRF